MGGNESSKDLLDIVASENTRSMSPPRKSTAMPNLDQPVELQSILRAKLHEFATTRPSAGLKDNMVYQTMETPQLL